MSQLCRVLSRVNIHLREAVTNVVRWPSWWSTIEHIVKRLSKSFKSLLWVFKTLHVTDLVLAF